ncbi:MULTISPECIES: glycine--tRNA ligase [unclassified Methanoregula]|uniref:glycine--tRNA ligase n=1 Tax=unclassified Methanoregula TaxID=2649730 RepID=UPI0009D167A8|nr:MULTISPECIES: glycine--tRNA ligase [unclassified Methanoregula]OPX62832.1 MAG: Threonine--tRNA ligase [Methanoregula sp. PtaB.Bin085]OPY35269.1 MAG: Threonine--tRNA ligase [Methanoregula sp. PtaU1.Bin006]
MSDVFENVMELAKRRGFIWPTSECYGAVAGFIDYGPLGAMMKRRIEDIWREFYVIREGYYEIECPTIAQEAVFIASGHVAGFADKMCQCPHCSEYLRADHVAEAGGIRNASTMKNDELAAALATCTCPACGKVLWKVEVFQFNLMFKTSIGPGSQRTGYLRPETAQGMFVDFARLLRFYRDKLPFGAVQIGKSYRNEISPRQGMIRLREFTQAEAEIFVHPAEKNRHPRFARYAGYSMPLLTYVQQQQCGEAVTMTMQEAVEKGVIANQYLAYYVALTHEMLVSIGIRPEKLRFRQHLPDERAHYATDCWDAEIHSGRFGWVETVGLADRTDYDLNAHAKQSGTPMTVFIQYDEPRKVPRRRIIPNMSVLGKQYRQKAKAIFAELETAVPTKDGADVVVDGEKIHIPADLFEVRDEIVDVRGEDIVPHVVEPSYGIDRMCYAVLEQAYDEDIADGEKRVVMRLSPKVAPVQVAVFPLMTRDNLDTIALDITHAFHTKGIQAEYDDSGAIGRRYRRQDEIGTPFAVTVDYDTKENNTVTLRDRDSMKQVRVPVADLPEIVAGLVAGSTKFAELK